MKKEEKFLEVLSEVINTMLNPFDQDIEKLEKLIVEKLIKKGYSLHEINDILDEIFKTINKEKNRAVFRMLSPFELENLSDSARDYLLNLKNKMIISEEEFENILDEINFSYYFFELEDLKNLLSLKGISENITIN
ncbi:uncharacterized protein DUF494 [Hypnocyclicus thermotrophus]|uniref:Uncharacterized protein DUF494 n=1 Tax=Hypnocyclicus thermotrophus TaxID=1627895 RepID=A0AA46I676_9FUSO|nr:DUF494 family protein [Hypnocyclicus thermotrophus]TDT71909.1 uncharacterized protein DUF494 [Hypnocyclicus thermotrophus]